MHLAVWSGPRNLSTALMYSFAARGSGTEPKMKFYLFANEKVGNVGELPAD